MIKIENLSKRYTLNQGNQNYSTLVDSLSSFFRRSKRKTVEPFWALNDVSLEIEEGARVGIIGRNGAGKSTLLKIISKITQPTRGSVKIRGRVASLLEVGTGFHLELSGKENIFLNGAILGMKNSEIKKKYDEIVAYAEVEKFLDTPVKRYSSGMMTRLGFAVAAHLDPDILIIDEVLAVGDMQFQEKCLKKLNDLGRSGKTVLFVSHNTHSILGLCDQGVLLDKGKLIQTGAIEKVLDTYLKKTFNQTQVWEGNVGDNHIRFYKASLPAGRPFFYQNEKLRLEIELEVLEPRDDLVVGVTLNSKKGHLLAHSYKMKSGLFLKPGKSTVSFTLDTSMLHEGEYLLTVESVLYEKKLITKDEIALTLPIYAQDNLIMEKNGDAICLGTEWGVQ